MNRFFACFSVVLLGCCAAAAQSSSPDPAGAIAPPAVTSTASTEVTQFQKIEDTWSDAVNRHDQYSLELVLSPLFVDVSASGDVTTRNQQVAQAINGDDKTFYLTQKVVTVRMLGDIAVVNGTYILHHRVNAAERDDKGVFTHVFQRVRGGWLCVNSQRTGVREEASGKTRKQSTAESPFHIPLFSRNDRSNP